MTTPTKRDVEKRLDDLDKEGEEESTVVIAYKDPETGDLYQDKSLEVPHDPPERGVVIAAPVPPRDSPPERES